MVKCVMLTDKMADGHNEQGKPAHGEQQIEPTSRWEEDTRWNDK